MMTTPSGINVNLILSPVFIPRLSRIRLGIVVWPLLVSVASVLMIASIILTESFMVRIRSLGKQFLMAQLACRNPGPGRQAAVDPIEFHFGGQVALPSSTCCKSGISPVGNSCCPPPAGCTQS
jgi:hypothetical protein